MNPNVLIVPCRGTRKSPFPPEPFDDRDSVLRKAYAYLDEKGVGYIPLDVEEDIQVSYDSDSPEEFRATVKGWMRELVKAGRGAA
jgi:hypothetical protein